MSELNLEKFRTVFLKSDGWQVSDCYKTYDDKFLRKDAQDAYEGAKWAWQEQQAKINELQKKINNVNEVLSKANIKDDRFSLEFALNEIEELLK